MRYIRFQIENFKAINKAVIDLSKEGLTLLLGINESGKTSILRALETFDNINDIEDEEQKNRFLKSIRNKKELDSQATITAEIVFERGDVEILSEKLELGKEKNIILKKLHTISISRIFIFKSAEFVSERYIMNIDINVKNDLFGELDEVKESDYCVKIISSAPYIQYFEDFKDQIPDYISTNQEHRYYDPDWADTIEGLFYHTDKNVDVKKFQGLTDDDVRNTIINKVNKVLNKQFTDRWNKKLKGGKQIHRANLEYDNNTKLFTFKIVGSDKATVFSVEERSKGALWYLSFLLKTEFRKKKLRAQMGKTMYLIDEPASNLHSSAQQTMLEDFHILASDSNVIYTTHSQYLIDKANLSNVYIIEHKKGKVEAVKYQEYVKGKSFQTSYFQPILDALQIQPYALDICWEKVLIVEGIYDYCGFSLMLFDVLKEKKKFVIMPGTGASSLTSLISLHIGWGADISVLLDNDSQGRANKEKYIRDYPNISNVINVYDFISSIDRKNNIEFEDLFEEEEKRKIAYLAGIDIASVNKKIFQQSILIISCSYKLREKLAEIIGQKTINVFRDISNKIKKDLAIDVESREG